MKALILELEKRHALVLTEQGFFLRVHRDPEHTIGAEIECEAALSAGGAGARAYGRAMRQALATAACIALILGSYIFCNTWETADYTVYMDINPGIRVEVNSLGRMIAVDPVNQDAVGFLEEVDMKGDLVTGLKTAAQEASERGLVQKGGIGVAVVADDTEKMRAITDTVESALPFVQLSFVYLTPEEEQAAYEEGIAPVRWKMAQEVAAQHPEIDSDIAVQLERDYLFALYRGEI
ncbi:MAG: anti-sigma factor domain-containing protein [Clostridiales Family XIII bacterium]|jgi:hypothetical protein|nr:anti-sigma factor domain-containing protein [Clostridiales Family XIII bacterium]